MNLGFVNPALLWGLLAAALPIVIHLINRRRARKVSFAATYFVQLSNQRLARSLKLKQWLLLALRTLLIAALVAWLARPYTRPPADALAAADTGRPTARLILLDASLSMQARHNGTGLFERAVVKARELTRSFPDSDAVGLVVAPLGDERPPLAPSFDRQPVLDALKRLTPTYLPNDFGPALERARALLEGSALPERRVYILGDLTRAGYDHDFRFDDPEGKSRVTAIDVREQAALPNLAVAALEAERAPFSGPRDWRVRVQVANFGSQPISALPLSVSIDGKNAADGFLDLRAGETGIKEFVVAVTQIGRLEMEAAIGVEADVDALEIDNRRHGVLDTGRDIRTLLINGRPSTTRYLDEIFYLKQALNPGGIDRSRIRARSLSPESFTPAALDEIDLVYLCHVPRLSSDAAAALVSFVTNGGALFMSMGPNIDVEAYNRDLAALLPGPLRGDHIGGDRIDPGRTGSAVYLSRLDTQYPAFRIFNDETMKSLTTTPVRRYMTFDSAALPDTTILAAYTDGSPALALKQVGQGRSLLYTTSVSRSWTDLPIQPGFLPLMQELAAALTTTGDRLDPNSKQVGEWLRLPDNARQATLIEPSGRRVKLTRDAATDRPVTPPFSVPGFYRLDSSAGEQIVAVETDLRESDLTPMDAVTRAEAFGSGSRLAGLAEGGLAEQRVEMAAAMAWLLLLLLLGEALVLRWMG